MKSEDEDKSSKVKLLFWMFMLDNGIMMFVTGQFFNVGDWDGPNISFAGSLLAVMSMFSIYAYFKKHWKEVKNNVFFTAFFLVLFAGSMTASAACLTHNIKAPILYWAIFPYLVGYFLHKKLTKGLPPESTTSSSFENATQKEK